MKEEVIKRLESLRHNISELKKLRDYSLEEIKGSTQTLWAIEHGLQISIQLLLDIGNIILADLGENRIEDYTDIIDKLRDRRVIPKDFAERIRGMAGLRNILVHEYLVVDVDELYSIIKERLGDFEEFISHIKRHLETER